MRELGRGNFGVTMLMQDLQTSEYVAAKFIQRGAKVGIVSALAADDGGRTDALHTHTHCDPLLQINVNVERELLNHRPLLHAHIIRFREVPLPVWRMRMQPHLEHRMLGRLRQCVDCVRAVCLNPCMLQDCSRTHAKAACCGLPVLHCVAGDMHVGTGKPASRGARRCS